MFFCVTYLLLKLVQLLRSLGVIERVRASVAHIVSILVTKKCLIWQKLFLKQRMTRITATSTTTTHESKTQEKTRMSRLNMQSISQRVESNRKYGTKTGLRGKQECLREGFNNTDLLMKGYKHSQEFFFFFLKNSIVEEQIVDPEKNLKALYKKQNSTGFSEAMRGGGNMLKQILKCKILHLVCLSISTIGKKKKKRGAVLGDSQD